MLEIKKSQYLGWIQNTQGIMMMSMEPLDVKDAESLIELSLYSILRGASNALRYLLKRTSGIGIDWEMVKMFRTEFMGHKWSNLPEYAYLTKIKLRQGQFMPNDIDAMLLSEKADSFLCALSKQINQYSNTLSIK